MRPGRLDRILYVGPPDHDGRKEILNIRMSAMKVEDTVDVDQIAQMVAVTFFSTCVSLTYRRPRDAPVLK